MMMMCSYCYYFFDLPVALFDCHMEGCASFLHHVCQGEFVAMHEIYLDGSGRDICRDCVDNLPMGGKPEKLKKVVHSTVYRREESE